MTYSKAHQISCTTRVFELLHGHGGAFNSQLLTVCFTTQNWLIKVKKHECDWHVQINITQPCPKWGHDWRPPSTITLAGRDVGGYTPLWHDCVYFGGHGNKSITFNADRRFIVILFAFGRIAFAGLKKQDLGDLR